MVPGLARFERRRATVASLCALVVAPASTLRLRYAQAQAREEDELPRIDDLRELGLQIRRTRVPLLLFFSTPGCPYCREVRSGYLAPRIREGAKDVVIREVEIRGRRSIVDLDGQASTEAELARRFEIRVVPVVQLVDAEMKPLGQPLVGISAAGFYESQLNSAIEAAGIALRRRG